MKSNISYKPLFQYNLNFSSQLQQLRDPKIFSSKYLIKRLNFTQNLKDYHRLSMRQKQIREIILDSQKDQKKCTPINSSTQKYIKTLSFHCASNKRGIQFAFYKRVLRNQRNIYQFQLYIHDSFCPSLGDVIIKWMKLQNKLRRLELWSDSYQYATVEEFYDQLFENVQQITSLKINIIFASNLKLVKHIAKLKQLKELSITYEMVEDFKEDLEPLYELKCGPQLESFSFSGEIDENDQYLVKLIQSFQNCEHLKLDLLGFSDSISIEEYFRNKNFTFKTFEFHSENRIYESLDHLRYVDVTENFQFHDGIWGPGLLSMTLYSKQNIKELAITSTRGESKYLIGEKIFSRFSLLESLELDLEGITIQDIDQLYESLIGELQELLHLKRIELHLGQEWLSGVGFLGLINNISLNLPKLDELKLNIVFISNELLLNILKECLGSLPKRMDFTLDVSKKKSNSDEIKVFKNTFNRFQWKLQ